MTTAVTATTSQRACRCICASTTCRSEPLQEVRVARTTATCAETPASALPASRCIFPTLPGGAIPIADTCERRQNRQNPNNTCHNATRVRPGDVVDARLDYPGDVDVYKLAPPAAESELCVRPVVLPLSGRRPLPRPDPDQRSPAHEADLPRCLVPTDPGLPPGGSPPRSLLVGRRVLPGALACPGWSGLRRGPARVVPRNRPLRVRIDSSSAPQRQALLAELTGRVSLGPLARPRFFGGPRRRPGIARTAAAKNSASMLRIRQLALVARDLEPVVEDLCAVLGVSVCFRDPGGRDVRPCECAHANRESVPRGGISGDGRHVGGPATRAQRRGRRVHGDSPNR